MNKLKILSIFLFTLIFLLFLKLDLIKSLWSTPSPQFNITPDELFVNWTDTTGLGPYTANITIGNNFTQEINLTIMNESSEIKNSFGIFANFLVLGFNGSDYVYENNITVNQNEEINITLIFNSSIPAGRYEGSFNIVNATNPEEANLTLPVTLDIPINVNSSGIGTFSGNVTNSTTEIYYFNTSNITNVVGLRINLTDFEGYLNISLYDNNNQMVRSEIVNKSISFNYIFPSFPAPSSYWYFKVSNFSIQDFIEFNGTLELLKPSLLINTTGFLNGTYDSNCLDEIENITLAHNLGLNATLSSIFWIKNLANYPINITVQNTTFLNNSNPELSDKYIEFEFNLTDGTILPESQNFTYVEFYINTTKTENSQGLYKTNIFINSDFGYPYKSFNLTLIINLTDQLLVNITELEPNIVNLNENVSINASVKYINGTNLSNLDTKNFTAWLSLILPDKEYNYDLTVLNSSPIEISPGFYQLNLTIPNIPGGNYSLYLKASDSNGLNNGVKKYGISNSSNALLVNSSGLWLSSDKTELALVEGDNSTITIFVNNYGSQNFSISDSNPTITVSPSTKCSILSYGSWSNTLVQAWSFENSINRTVRIKGIEDGNCYLYVNGTTKNWFRNISIPIYIYNATGGGETPPGGGEVSYFYNLTFLQAESLIVLKQNSTNSTIVIVKNTGNASQEITFSILNINSSWYRINSSGATLAPNQQVAFLVNFSVGMEEAKDYTGRFRAYSPNKTIISDFILRILPLVAINESQIREINDTLLIYKVKMLNYSLQINASKEKGYNVSSAEQILSQLEEKIEEAENLVAQGNYTAAQELFPTIQTLLNQLEEELKKIARPEGKGLDWTLIVIVIVGVAGAIILIYLFWPTKTGYIVEKKKYVYKPKRKEVKEKLKEKWEKATKRRK